MLCCWKCIPKMGREEPSMVDVEKVVQDYVWGQYMDTCKPWQRLITRRKNFDIEIPMHYFVFRTVDQEEDPRQGAETSTGLSSRKDEWSTETLTTYRNDTDVLQTHKFRLEKMRKSNMAVTLQHGFNFGEKANFNVKLPTATIGTESDVRYTVTNTEHENMEETAIFETSSDIQVEKRSQCVAKVTLNEVYVDYKFKAKVLLTFVTTGAPTVIRRKRDREVFFTHDFSNLRRAFQKHESVYVNIYPERELEELATKNRQKEAARNGNDKDNPTSGAGQKVDATSGAGEKVDATSGAGQKVDTTSGAGQKVDATSGAGQKVDATSGAAEENKTTSWAGNKAGNGLANPNQAGGGLEGNKILFTVCGVIQGCRYADQRVDLEKKSLDKNAVQLPSTGT